MSLLDLLNLSIGSPQKGAVNFNALQVLLYEVLRHLDLQEVTVRWEDAPLGHRHSEEGATTGKELQAGTEPQQQTFGSRIRSCEDGVTEVRSAVKPACLEKIILKWKTERLNSYIVIWNILLYSIKT